MNFWRVRIGWLAVVTLTLQVGVMASAAAALCCGPDHHAAAEEMPCCKEARGAPHVCPLKKAPKPGEATIEACCTPDEQALAALFALSGPPERPYQSIAAAPSALVAAITAEQPVALVPQPDAPPPRR